jgi:hypothetical protein
VAVKRERSKGEMWEPSGAKKPEKTAEELTWAEMAKRTAEENRRSGDKG